MCLCVRSFRKYYHYIDKWQIYDNTFESTELYLIKAWWKKALRNLIIVLNFALGL